MKKFIASAMVMCMFFAVSTTVLAQDTKKEPAKKECCKKDCPKDKKDCPKEKKDCPKEQSAK